MLKNTLKIEALFLNAVQIEYNYYVKREQARQEQVVIREQMRQEAAERKALEAERKKKAGTVYVISNLVLHPARN